ncbi:MAG: 30S ribosomal protein S14 [Chromatiales bacterium]|nr:30S ribosomal protein S14 [Chromatiales bacterium]
MAKTSIIQREIKRQKQVDRFAKKRAELKRVIRSPASSPAERQAAQAQLQGMPRDASPTRLRNRCSLSGRPKGVYRKFGLGRTKLREQAMQGNVPGLSKASW